MGFLQTGPFSLLSLSHALPLITILVFFTPSAKAASDLTNLVYKGCSAQQFQDPSRVYSQILKSLFESLVPKSTSTNFASSTSGDGISAISGLYQCRGDLGNGDCYNCVTKVSSLFGKLCGRAVAARIQLSGCYLRYEISGFQQASGTELLYKLCGSTRGGGPDFDGIRETAFQTVEKGVQGGASNGFYKASFGSGYVLGQCEGDFGSGDCGDCVKSALERARDVCGDSVSGQVYLQKCYVDYSYYPNYLVTKTSSGKRSTEKLVAVIVGGTAGLGFVIVCLLCARSVLKRK